MRGHGRLESLASRKKSRGRTLLFAALAVGALVSGMLLAIGARGAVPLGSATTGESATPEKTTTPTSSPTETSPSATSQRPIEAPLSGGGNQRPQAGRPTTKAPPVSLTTADQAPQPKVIFTGTTANPTITVSGNGFGSAPAGAPWNDTQCGSYTDNGKNYGPDLSFLDTGNFAAGNGACIGIKVLTWSSNRVVFRFGDAYNTFDRWYVTSGDSYEITLVGQRFTGEVAFS